MATKTTASRFALLKIEDDYDSEEEASKPKQINAKGNQQSTGAKKKNKKKKKAEQSKIENDELRNLAFGGKGKGGGGGGNQAQGTPKSNSGSGEPTEAQWDEWKKMDVGYAQDAYEKDLQKAILQSKLDSMAQKEGQSAAPSQNDEGSRAPGKDGKKKKKKDTKPAAMSLEQFIAKDEEKNNHVVDPDQDTSRHKSPEADPDPKFFKKVDDDVSKTIMKEKIQEEYAKQYVVENARTQQYQANMDKKDEEIESSRETNKKLEAELKQVKKRNQQLCHILAQGEMKDKTAVLMELEQLKQIRDELTQEVTDLNTELEKERSKVHAVKSELDKALKGGKEKESHGGKHGK